MSDISKITAKQIQPYITPKPLSDPLRHFHLLA